MGQAKSAYNLQHALPHWIGPFSRHTIHTMPSLGIQHKLMQMAIYIYPIVCINKNYAYRNRWLPSGLRLRAALTPPTNNEPSRNRIFTNPSPEPNLAVGLPLASRRTSPNGHSHRLHRRNRFFQDRHREEKGQVAVEQLGAVYVTETSNGRGFMDGWKTRSSRLEPSIRRMAHSGSVTCSTHPFPLSLYGMVSHLRFVASKRVIFWAVV
jgi:hypothetical protein